MLVKIEFTSGPCEGTILILNQDTGLRLFNKHWLGAGIYSFLP